MTKQIINNILKNNLFLLILLIYTVPVFSQPTLTVLPDSLIYDDLFKRSKTAIFKNSGNQTLRIDSVVFNDTIYFGDYNNNGVFPFFIAPGDSVSMECLFWNYYKTGSSVREDILIYSNSPAIINYLYAGLYSGTEPYPEYRISGTISFNSNPVPNVPIYFFREGKILYDSTITNSAGEYEKYLPTGYYQIASKSNGSHLTFYGATKSPFGARFVNLNTSVNNIDFNLLPALNTPFSASGKVKSLTGAVSNKGIVVVKRTVHNPGKPFSSESFDDYFASLLESDGSYLVSNLPVSDNYLISTTPNFRLQGYYNTLNQFAPYLSGASPVFISGPNSDLDIFSVRDSTFGAGTINGTVTFSGISDSSLFKEISVFAINTATNFPYAFGYVHENGSFTLNELPIGTFYIYAELPGFPPASSSNIVVTRNQPVVNNVEINFTLNSIKKEELPSDFYVSTNYPNPVTSNFTETSVGYGSDSRGIVSFKLFDITGELISDFYSGEISGINNILRIDFKNLAQKVSQGTYFLKAVFVSDSGNTYQKVIKITYLK